MVRVAVIDSGARGSAIMDAYIEGMRGKHEDFDGLRLGSRCTTDNKRIDINDHPQVFAKLDEFEPDLVDVANDESLASGLVDKLLYRGYNVFGPTKKAARIEWDKNWAREFMKRHNIPSPRYKAFDITHERRDAREFAMYIIESGKTAFIKASGLDGGKGVISASNAMDISGALFEMKRKGKSAGKILVEEGIFGEEFSYFAITDGKTLRYFKSAQDNKRLYDGDRGPNTGGMGAHSPALVTSGFEKRIREEIMQPTVEGLAKEGRTYKGILYLGGIITPDKEIKVIEFNSRWGDPECLTILPGLITSYYDLVSKTIEGKLSEIKLRQDTLSRIAVVAVSKGYPDKYEIGKVIETDYSKMKSDTYTVDSAVIREFRKPTYSNGGRLFSVVAKDKDLKKARAKAMAGISCYSIAGNGLHYRTDIAERDIKRIEKRNKRVINGPKIGGMPS